MTILSTLQIVALRAALHGNDDRQFLVGAAGIRPDGAIVHAHNSPGLNRTPNGHAEARLVKRLGSGAKLVVVARWLRSGGLGLARPCAACAARLKAKGVGRVVYSKGEGEWGWMRF